MAPYDLKDTADLMKSGDYKEMFMAEYLQTKIRYEKLHRMLVKYDEGKLEFTPTCPIGLLREQASAMEHYLYTLMARADIEGIRIICCDKTGKEV